MKRVISRSFGRCHLTPWLTPPSPGKEQMPETKCPPQEGHSVCFLILEGYFRHFNDSFILDGYFCHFNDSLDSSCLVHRNESCHRGLQSSYMPIWDVN